MSGVYDLFDNLCEDEIVCQINQNGGIAFGELAHNMNNVYNINGAKRRVLNAIQM